MQRSSKLEGVPIACDTVNMLFSPGFLNSSVLHLECDSFSISHGSDSGHSTTPPVDTRNPKVLGSLEPTPKEPLRRRVAQGVVWVKPLSTGSPIVVFRVSPYRRYCGQHTFLHGWSRASRCHRARPRPQYGAAVSARSGTNTAHSPCLRAWRSP